MGRGKGWDSGENEALAKAWIASSEDPLVALNQTGKEFVETLRRRFVDRGPKKEDVSNGRFGQRTSTSIKQYFSDLSADVQKFQLSLRRVRASSITAVGEEGILSMAVAVHVGETNVVDYEYKTFHQDSWLN